ncbi:MAG TPA: 23S rRNA (uracil(1939)-C(5))-methyltransferase RlmD [Rhabdochlamydiaceae bacterium]|nr:23S rRNA (uracil(1939)-C(5))-methyltransferase RlmD [Rhabdochlamydiaceae bacterium]
MKEFITLTIERLGINGEGIGHLNGYTIFAPGALPGEKVSVRLTEKKSRYAHAELVEILIRSSARREAPCPYFGRCGGCQLMHLDYLKQLETKRQRVCDALQRIGKLEGIEVAPCIPSPSSLAYRNKIQMPVAPGNPVRLGLYAQNSHDLVEINSCMIHCELGDKVFQKVQEVVKRAGEKIKHLLIKTAVSTNEALVIFVTHEKASAALSLMADQIIKALPEVKGVIHNLNSSSSNTILGTTFHTLAGSDCIEEKLCGLTFKVSPASFFQVNPRQAAQLYEKVAQFADLQGNETVLDAYCGVGTLSLILAQKAQKVIGVESVADAIKDAKENALKNKITNATFICAKAEDAIKTLEEIDIAIINPPRKGCEMSFLESLAHLRPKGIVYISCDPATLARDLALLCKRGFKVDAVVPLDMFPQTAHVETIVKLI